MARKYLGGSGRSLTVWVSIAASTVLVFYGYDQGVFGNVLVSDDFLRVMSNPSTSLQGNMTSVYNLGCFAGAFSTIWLGDILGRPRTILLGSTIIAIGGLIQAASYSVAQIMVGRIIAGCGTGMNTATAGIWQAETSQMTRRGKLIVIQMANFFSLLIYSMCPFLPDSPRLLIRKGKDQEGLEVLAALIGNGATPESPDVRSQYRIIKDVLDREHVSTYKWYEILSGKGPSGLLRRMVLGAWMLAMTQLSGINITSYYMTYVFVNALKFTTFLSRVLSAAGSVVYLIFSILAYFIIEGWGRRAVTMVSSFGCAVCWLMVTIMQALTISDAGNAQAYNIVAVVFFFVFWAAFGMGLLPVPWLYPTEINALEARTVGTALAVCTNWLINYMVAEVTPIGIANLGWRFWIIWAVINASFIPIVYFLYPETANRSLEDIDRFFETNPGILVHRNSLALQLQRPSIFAEEDVRVGYIVKEEGAVIQHDESKHPLLNESPKGGNAASCRHQQKRRCVALWKFK
ncbi:general substrate transporter [Aspergillus ambiguus]|uniref:general substrate transporter n=1 Tax=Aspergillus ambiguus TaxID=176160 RepID=UPI003CCDF524